MADGRVFLAGLVAGAMGGLLVGRLKAQQGQPRRMPYLDAGQQVLAEVRGPVQAALLAARVQARYDDLYAHRLRFAQPALRQHYEEGILPSLALYQTLRETERSRKRRWPRWTASSRRNWNNRAGAGWCRSWAACRIRSQPCGSSIAGR